MTNTIILFDIDGVLLESEGYHRALRTSLSRIGAALGVPGVELSTNQIARFEALSVTNEWDSLAICTALVLLEVWKVDGTIRLISLEPNSSQTIEGPIEFDRFLDRFVVDGCLPGSSAFDLIVKENNWLDEAQRQHLSEILHQCRDIYRSPTLPGHQETVIGSKLFKEVYGLEPRLYIESYLSQFDRPVMTPEQDRKLKEWLSNPKHKAGFMTSRPCFAPDGFLSAPEAEIAVRTIGYDQLPTMGSGLLAWYASTRCHGDEHQFLKPNPVHALALLQMCSGLNAENALKKAVELHNGNPSNEDWKPFGGVKVVIFEDSAKGLQSGIGAKTLLSSLGIRIELSLIGVTRNAIKHQALEPFAHRIIPSINEIKWWSL
jgi:phosphoglycolate phosphatase-like HAD superfamily hydrolase